MNRSLSLQSIDWDRAAQRSLLVAVSCLHWLTYNTGNALLIGADKLATVKKRLGANPSRRRSKTR